ncbi:hypothetical protein D3C86_1598310 [compost metagenome]
MNEAGILLELDETPKVGDEETDSDDVSDVNDLSGVSAEELNQLLADAVKEEDFDTALRLQEEIKRRNKKID